MYKPYVVSRSEWSIARAKFLEKEKAATRARDELAAERRRLPMMKVDKSYIFQSPSGPKSLVDLFDGRRQLIVYHHMLKLQDPAPCEGCCMVADNIGHLDHIHARDVSLVLVSRAPIGEIEAFRLKMGWDIPWYHTGEEFNADHDVTGGGFGLNVFYRDGNTIYRSYYTKGRGVEALGSNWSFLDLTPWGRQEDWEDSPPATPQGPPYHWWRRHGEYDESSQGKGACTSTHS